MTLNHEAIPYLNMDAMTMVYTVRDPANSKTSKQMSNSRPRKSMARQIIVEIEKAN